VNLHIHSPIRLYGVVLVSGHGVSLSPLCTAAIVWPIVPARMTDDNDGCGVSDGMRIGKGN
jgi:hypothetical protein